jgi:hypothetical protein
MKIIVRECYLEAGYSYHFSNLFTNWLVRELGKRIRPSKAFIQAYSKDFAVGISLGASSKVSEPEVEGPKTFRRDKEVVFYILLPHPGGPCPTEPKGYARAVKLLLGSIATGLQRLGLNDSRVVEDTPALIQHFIARPDMIFNHDWDKRDVEQQSKKTGAQTKVSESSQPSTAKTAASRVDNKRRRRARRITLPKWKIPKNIEKRVEYEGGMWEDERFDPILLTVISDTSYQGREIPLAWQIEFDPSDRLAAANEEIQALGIEPDGDGWSEVIQKRFAKRHPKLAKELHSDSESSTCVIWVESEGACRKLIAIVWDLLHPGSTARASRGN